MNRKYVGNSIWGQKTFKNPIKENNLISFIVQTRSFILLNYIYLLEITN